MLGIHQFTINPFLHGTSSINCLLIPEMKTADNSLLVYPKTNFNRTDSSLVCVVSPFSVSKIQGPGRLSLKRTQTLQMIFAWDHNHLLQSNYLYLSRIPKYVYIMFLFLKKNNGFNMQVFNNYVCKKVIS